MDCNICVTSVYCLYYPLMSDMNSLISVIMFIWIFGGSKYQFNTVDFVERKSIKSTVSLSPLFLHTGNKVDRIGDKVVRVGHKVDRVAYNVDRDKLSNSSCCRFVTKTSNKVDSIGNSRLCCRFVAGFGNSRLCCQRVPR